jgi:hypothetical protein
MARSMPEIVGEGVDGQVQRMSCAHGVALQAVQVQHTPTTDTTEYRSIFESLWYLVHTRPNLSLPVGFVSRFMEAPAKQHLAAVKHILRYIVGSMRLGFRYGRSSGAPCIVEYSDNDLGGGIGSRKSKSVRLFFQGSTTAYGPKRPVGGGLNNRRYSILLM